MLQFCDCINRGEPVLNVRDMYCIGIDYYMFFRYLCNDGIADIHTHLRQTIHIDTPALNFHIANLPKFVRQDTGESK